MTKRLSLDYEPSKRWSWFIAVLVAALVMVPVVGGCYSKPDLAAQEKQDAAQEREFAAQEKQYLALQKQDRVLAARQRVAAGKARAAEARRRLTLRRREVAAIRAMRRRAAHGLDVLQSFGFTPYTLCVPIKGKNQQPTERSRQQALKRLNLSC